MKNGSENLIYYRYLTLLIPDQVKKKTDIWKKQFIILK